jgi:hypothetical protein
MGRQRKEVFKKQQEGDKQHVGRQSDTVVGKVEEEPVIG